MTEQTPAPDSPTALRKPDAATPKPAVLRKMPVEIGGPAGPEPTRYGDWGQKGRCTDF